MAKKPARSVDSLLKLLEQINKAVPKRSKKSDGWIGDAKHAARHSDHNPEPDGTVDARDFTHDPKSGADMRVVAEAIRKSKDKRVSYMIFEGKIMGGRKGPQPWAWRKYSGKNGHYQHLHMSVLDEGQDDKTPWSIGDLKPVGAAAKKPAPKKPVHNGSDDSEIFPFSTYQNGLVHDELRKVQLKLDELGYPEVGSADGRWGNKTATAVMAFRNENDLTTTATIDQKFLLTLMTAKPREIAPSRANATVADLRAEGAEDIKEADQQQIAGGAAVAIPAAAGAATLIEKAESYGGLFKRAADIVEPYKDFLVENAIWILIALGVFVAYKAYRQKQIRLEKHRLGQDVSR